MRPAAAFGKPFTYLAAAPPPTAPTTATANDIRPPLQQQLQSPVPASVLHTFGSSTASGGGVPPTPPVRTSTATGKQKPPPVPPRGEQTRLTTVPAKRPEPPASVVPSPPPPPPPKPLSPPPLSTANPTEDDQPPPPPPPPIQVHELPTSPPPAAVEPEEDLSASALISKFENGCAIKSAAAVTTVFAAVVDHKPAAVDVDSGTSTLAESTDDDETGGGCGEEDVEDDDEDDGAADIWVRTIESPVKNPQKVRHHSDSALKAATATVSSWPSVEKRGSLPADAAVAVDNNNSNNKKSSPPTVNKESTRSSFRSANGSRCTSPALLSQNNDGRRITAAEALGVVAKPCPRILPSSASLDVACRRQSLSNLTTDSRFSTLLSSSVRSSWAPPSGVQTDVESTQSEPSFDYRRKKFTKRCSSADGRNPVHHHHHHHHYHTMSGTRVTAARDPDFGAKRAFIQEKLQAASAKMRVVGMVTPTGLPPTPPPPIAYQQHNGGGADDCGRPPRASSCNCGQHQATSRPMFVNKRTVSAEELLPAPPTITGTITVDPDPFAAVGRPVSSSAGGGRGSFGRSQRVTFALDQHQQLFATTARSASSATTEQGSSSSSSSSSIAKKPFKSNLKVKDTAVPELNVLGTSAINTRLPPQHPHPYGLPYKLPAVTADVLQGKGNPAVMKTLHKPKQSSYGGSPSPDLMLKEGNLRRSRPQTSVQDGCATLNGGLGRHSSSGGGHSDTSPETDNTLVYRDGILLSGPLPSLIQHLVPTTDYYPDQAYLFAFILSSRLFVKPHELLAKVVGVCHAQQRLGDPVSAAQNVHHKDQLSRFVPRLVQLLAEWTDKFPYDFRDERVMAHVREITHQCVSVEPAVRHQVSAMLQTLLHRLTALDKYETFLQQTGTDATVNVADALSPTDTMEVCSSASLLGQQLTLIELERLSFIGPEEFVQAFAKDSPHIDSSFKDMKKTKNLESYVHWFNRLSYLVASEICKHSKKKQRVKTIEFWIETARECFNVGNFNSLMAIIAGLNMSPISRLKKTWHKVQQSAKFTILEQYMDPSSNFSSYRSTLKAALWRSAGATDQRQRVVIPFFSLLVKDIYFLNEGCRNRLDNGHINFEKFWQLAKQVTEFITWKQAACPYEKNANLVLFLLTTPVLNEKALTLLSFEREPPDNSVEKEHYKILKTAS
ncbi:Ras guanine-nucleotide exchange factor, conserved site,Ras-like guanine nucleotide exchange [Cinara cedri]|uniref:Ras guanine-nucleotide exchange factor, conserved site,Ras-like guanine nucleotide exchange n=1 Tax=Cinara cedri TaxID=506608 RepID=A0A5E4MD40_9HEMI|nr:Ras guanine-nucleotide exchange factor, conserved site,Ras-like guanine nucleotide exchange [Cinara cedri]